MGPVVTGRWAAGGGVIGGLEYGKSMMRISCPSKWGCTVWMGSCPLFAYSCDAVPPRARPHFRGVRIVLRRTASGPLDRGAPVHALDVDALASILAPDMPPRLHALALAGTPTMAHAPHRRFHRPDTRLWCTAPGATTMRTVRHSRTVPGLLTASRKLGDGLGRMRFGARAAGPCPFTGR